jgi:cell fate (sporulation/competence/biofilm development) regulator YlbF (YheA/YmcA/DUF963 family)
MLDPTMEAATRTLAQRLRESEPIATFEQARSRLESDREAKALLSRLLERQRELTHKQQAGQLTQLEIDSLRRLQEQVQSNPIVAAYLEALQQAQSFLPSVNASISALLGFDFGGLARSTSL